MSEIESSVLIALTLAAKDAVSNAATALTLATADVGGSNTATAHRDALVDALRRRPSAVTKAQKKEQAKPLAPPAPGQVEIWSLYADHVEDSLLRGHLHHLLLDAGHGRRQDHARGAACAYLDAAQLLAARDGHGLVRAARCLKRAGELSLRFNQHDLREGVANDALALAERLLAAAHAGDEDEGRALLVVLETLQSLECDVVDLAERACSLFTSDMGVRIGPLGALHKAAHPSRHAEIDADVVRTFLDAADAADAGHRRLYFLTEAATEADKKGLPDLRARAEMALQQTRPEWTSIRTEGTIPPVLIASQQRLIDAAPDLRTALWRTVRDIHPAMHAQAKLEAEGALEGLLRIPRSRINPAGPVFVRPPADADDDLAVEMQVRGLRLFGILTAVQLDRIHERFQPDEVEMTVALTHETVLPEARARTLAQAFCYYWLREFDAAACVALPQVEQILRQLLRSQVPVVSVARKRSPGGVDLLGGLLQSMPKAGYPADWSKALELLLVDPDRGMNLRNDILHGLAGTPPRHHVALILQAALYLLSHAHGQRTPPRTTA